MSDRLVMLRGVSHASWLRLAAAGSACERLAERAPLRFSLAAAGALLVVAAAAFQISYDTNDDVFMTMIVSGKGFSAAPDEHLIFTNVLVGRALKWLYTAWPLVPWYGCYLLAVHYAAQVATLFCALTIPARSGPAGGHVAGVRPRLGLYLVYFALVELTFLNNLQFTTTAFLAAQAGIFLFLLAARRRSEHAQAAVVGPLAVAVAFLLAAALVRTESLLMALLVAGPLVGLLLLRRAWRPILVPCGAAAIGAAGLIALANWYDHGVYEQDPAWSRFVRFNELRVKFNDYGWTSYTPQTAGLFAAVGWSKNDHEMIAHWFFDDPVLYSEARLRRILDAYPWMTARWTGPYFREVCRRLLQDRAVWAVLLVLPAFLVTIDRRRQARWMVLGCASVGLGLVLLLIFCFKLPPLRTYFPLLSFPLAAALLFPRAALSTAANAAGSTDRESQVSGPHARRPETIGPGPVPRLVAVLLVVGIVMGVYHQCRRSVHVHRKRAALAAFLDRQRPGDNRLLVSWEATLPFELLSPLDNLESWSERPLVSLAWMQQAPWQEEIKRRFGITNIARAMCQRDDIVLVATPLHRELLVTFAKEHFQADIEFVPLGEVGENIVAGRFTSAVAETAERPSGKMPR